MNRSPVQKKFLALHLMNSMQENKEKSSHILAASSNLLGICFILLTSLKVLDISKKTIIDEISLIAIVLFMGSCVFSFLSIRSNTKRCDQYEKIADFIFLGGLLLLFVTTLLFTFDIIS
jgi:hypothetical protein